MPLKDNSSSIVIDLLVDDTVFSMFFDLLDPAEFTQDGLDKGVDMAPGEVGLPSVKVIPVDFFYNHLKEPLEYFETYLKKEYNDNVQFNYVSF
jgi:hypothetical protein